MTSECASKERIVRDWEKSKPRALGSGQRAEWQAARSGGARSHRHLQELVCTASRLTDHHQQSPSPRQSRPRALVRSLINMFVDPRVANHKLLGQPDTSRSAMTAQIPIDSSTNAIAQQSEGTRGVIDVSGSRVQVGRQGRYGPIRDEQSFPVHEQREHLHHSKQHTRTNSP
jgi:hypothetical protein